VFKIISRNLIKKRTEDINIQKEKQNNLISRFSGHYRKNQQETQSIGILDMLKGLQSIIGRSQIPSASCEFSEVVESFTAKGEDGLTSYFILDVLEAKIF